MSGEFNWESRAKSGILIKKKNVDITVLVNKQENQIYIF